jgi:hypothetical protein
MMTAATRVIQVSGMNVHGESGGDAREHASGAVAAAQDQARQSGLVGQLGKMMPDTVVAIVRLIRETSSSVRTHRDRPGHERGRGTPAR